MQDERENEAKTIRWSIASRIRMDESKLENLLNGANTKTLNGEITNGEFTSGEKSDGYRLFACKS